MGTYHPGPTPAPTLLINPLSATGSEPWDGEISGDGPDRYYVPVFGVRDTRSLDLTVRGNWTFTPDLSLDLYSQLFVARGRYGDFQVLTDPKTLRTLETYPKQDVFSISSFQLNAVLRWEYRPGSTLFLVWTQGRRADEQMNPLAPAGPTPYDRPFDEQIADTFGLFPTNTVLVKLNYTFLR